MHDSFCHLVYPTECEHVQVSAHLNRPEDAECESRDDDEEPGEARERPVALVEDVGHAVHGTRLGILGSRPHKTTLVGLSFHSELELGSSIY